MSVSSPETGVGRERGSVLFVCNRQSRRGGEQGVEALSLLRKAGLSVVELWVDDPQDLAARTSAALSADPSIGTVAVAGGDGTLAAIAGALLGTGRGLGIIPLGTANDLARTLGIPTDLGAACDIIATGVPTAVDIGTVNGRCFFNAASIGLGPHIAKSLDPAVKRRWGTLGYALRAANAVRKSAPFSAHVDAASGKLDVESLQITIGNGRFYGGGLTVAADATIDDGRLDLYSLAPISRRKLLRALPALISGRHTELEEVSMVKDTAMTITTERPMDISTDGELTTRTPAAIQVLPRAVSVLVARRTGHAQA